MGTQTTGGTGVMKAAQGRDCARSGRRIGRASKLTPERQEIIVNSLKEGNYLVTACGVANVSNETVQGWKRRGYVDTEQGNDTIYSRFLASLKLAEAGYEAGMVRRVNESSRKNPFAEMMLLARRFPERWQERRDTPGAGGSGVSINIQLTQYKAPQLTGTNDKAPALPASFDGGFGAIDIESSSEDAGQSNDDAE